MKTTAYIPFLLIITQSIISHAQIDTTSLTNQVDDLESYLFDTEDPESGSYEELLEKSEQTAGILNLNTLRYEEAVTILHLSDYQYYKLQQYIEEHGQLVSMYELAAIDGFDKINIEQLRPFVTAIYADQPNHFWKNLFSKSKQSLLLRYGQILEHQAGYDTNRATHYNGSPAHLCFRYNFSSQDKLFIKLSGEKDPGESFFKGDQKRGFDFYSGSISLKNCGLIQSAVIGDYRLNFGQGLLMGSSLLSGKGGAPQALRRFSSGIRAIAPTNEGNFLRGSAITIGTNKIEGSLFFGSIFGKTDNTAGFDFAYRHALFRIGLRTCVFSQTDTSAKEDRTKWASLFRPTYANFSTDYQFIIKKHLLFGEIALNTSGKIGCVNTLWLHLTPITQIAIEVRHYDKGFSAPLSSQKFKAGESGIYQSIEHIINQKTILNGFCNYYVIDGLSYRTDAPISVAELGFNIEYNIRRNSTLRLRYSWNSKPENGLSTEHYKALHEHHRHKFRLLWSNAPFSFLKLKTEINCIANQYPIQKERYMGFLLYQDIALHWEHPDISVNTRIAYFNTDRYEERLYAYEDDIYYAFTIGSYYYQGFRNYFVIRYKIKWFSIWFRIAQSYYINKQTIGSGLNEIQKPHKTEIKIQTLFSF